MLFCAAGGDVFSIASGDIGHDASRHVDAAAKLGPTR
jgi:hypothetical protein